VTYSALEQLLQNCATNILAQSCWSHLEVPRFHWSKTWFDFSTTSGTLSIRNFWEVIPLIARKSFTSDEKIKILRPSFNTFLIHYLRFNFTWGVPVYDSRGERGAASAECFIAQGKANNRKLPQHSSCYCNLLIVVVPNFNVISPSEAWFMWRGNHRLDFHSLHTESNLKSYQNHLSP
jgi:hypothetical protein